MKNAHDPADDIHESMQKDAINDKTEESKYASLFKRLFLFFIGIFLLYLSLTYLGIGSYMLQIFEGQIVSKEVNENFTIAIGNQTTVIFEQNVYNDLLVYYIAHQRYEFAACFFGNLTQIAGEKVYTLTAMEIPHMYSQSVHRVLHAGCPQETLVALHTHPYKQCLFSEQDINSFFTFHKSAPNGLYALMCEENRFTFYGY